MKDLLDKEIENLYLNEKMNITKIAKTIEKSRSYVNKVISKNKLREFRWSFLSEENLRREFVDNNKTKKEIAEEYGCDISTISSQIKKFNIIKKYQDKEFLYEQFIVLNKSPLTIAEELGISISTLENYLYDKFNLKKEKDLRNKSMLKRFKNTMRDVYNVENPMHLEKFKENNISSRIESGHIKTFDSKRVSQISDESGVPYSTIISNLNKFGSEQLPEIISGHKGGKSPLESFVETEFDIPLWNKKFDKEKYPNLNYRPDFKLSNKTALNVDGLLYHSSLYKKDKYYHFKMRKAYEERGLKIIQFRTNEVLFKKEILKSMIKVQMNKAEDRIFARKCTIKYVNKRDSDFFNHKNHMMSSLVGVKSIGLYKEGRLVALMSYRIKNNNLIIERFSSKINTIVIGGFSKLLRFLERNYSFNSIHYWVDLRYGTGTFLLKHNFKIEKETLGWKWTDFKTTYNRLKCRANMDERALSEREHAKELGWVRIYDAGQRLYIK